jgi:hypothetical protein
MKIWLPCALAALTFGCGSSAEEDTVCEAVLDASLMSREERTYAESAKPFLQAVVQKKYEAAYRLLSIEAREALPYDAFVETLEGDEREFGTPVSLDSVYGVYTMKELAEHDEGEGLDALVTADALGTTPDSIPVDLRRASVKGEIGLGRDEDGSELSCILTVVLVEELGDTKVGWFWMRERGLWD